MYFALRSLLDPFLVVFLALGVALGIVWRRRSEDRRRLRPVLALYLAFYLVCNPLVAQLALLTLEWPFPPTFARPASIDAIVVLSGSLRNLDGQWKRVELGLDTRDRCRVAAELYHAGPACPLFVTGGKVEADRDGPTLARAMADALPEWGVPPTAIVLEESSTTTYENAVETAKLLNQQEFTRVALVTDATHLPRAVRCFQRQGIEAVPCSARNLTAGFEWSPGLLLPRATAALDLNVAVHEWLGLAWYKLRGRI